MNLCYGPCTRTHTDSTLSTSGVRAATVYQLAAMGLPAMGMHGTSVHSRPSHGPQNHTLRVSKALDCLPPIFVFLPITQYLDFFLHIHFLPPGQIQGVKL